MRKSPLQRLHLAALAAAVSTMLPVWADDTGHGRGCSCAVDFTLASGGLFVPSLLLAVIALVRLRYGDGRGPLPFALAWRALHVLATIAVLGLAVLCFDLAGVGALPGALAHTCVAALAAQHPPRRDDA